jgi:predicted ATP-grasp superfamily ATP-dependent carboligase
LSVRTNTPEGARFFESLGFEPVTGLAECTHLRALPASSSPIIGPMRVLLTSSRAPVTLELIRAFGQAGHTVHAADTFAPTLGSASRHLRRHHVVPPPRHDPAGFGRALVRIVEACGIDVLIPTCEEVFHLGRHHAALSAVTRVLCPPLAELDRWHNKETFQRFADSRGVRTPRTLLVSSPDERDAAIDLIPRWVLKPAYSRFAARVVTRWGLHAGRVPLEACAPTDQEPWLAQEYVEGEAECSYSVAHGGRLTAHCAYRTPHRIGGGAGVSFRAAEGEPTRRIVERLLEGTGYTGQLSLDFLVDEAGERWLLECNPRTTSAVHVMDPAALVRALLVPEAPMYVEPPGRYQQLLPVVLSVGGAPAWSDVVFRLSDPLPFVASLSQMWHFSRVARRGRLSMVEATTEDIEYNGPGDGTLLA